MKQFFVIKDGRQKMLPDMPRTLENYMYIEEDICYLVNTEDGDMVWRIRQPRDCAVTSGPDNDTGCEYGIVGCYNHFLKAYNLSEEAEGENAAAEWLGEAFAQGSSESGDPLVIIFGART